MRLDFTLRDGVLHAALADATFAEDAALHSVHQYIEVLARQRNVAYRAFSREPEALDWLQKGVRNLFPGKGS